MKVFHDFVFRLLALRAAVTGGARHQTILDADSLLVELARVLGFCSVPVACAPTYPARRRGFCKRHRENVAIPPPVIDQCPLKKRTGGRPDGRMIQSRMRVFSMPGMRRAHGGRFNWSYMVRWVAPFWTHGH